VTPIDVDFLRELQAATVGWSNFVALEHLEVDWKGIQSIQNGRGLPGSGVMFPQKLIEKTVVDLFSSEPHRIGMI
jgi:hypothetical protein